MMREREERGDTRVVEVELALTATAGTSHDSRSKLQNTTKITLFVCILGKGGRGGGRRR